MKKKTGFVVVLVKGGIPQEVLLESSWPKARAAARSFVQACDFKVTIDAVQVFDLADGSEAKLLTNGVIDQWIDERSSNASSKK